MVLNQAYSRLFYDPSREGWCKNMVIFFGITLFGRCEEVPGKLFFVGTKFFHIMMIPLIPLESCLVVSTNDEGWHGVPIQLNLKSVLLAWFRAFCLFVIVFTAVAGPISISNGPSVDRVIGAIIIAVCVLSVLALLATYFYRPIRYASFRRARK